jgi:hypothetical protein
MRASLQGNQSWLITEPQLSSRGPQRRVFVAGVEVEATFRERQPFQRLTGPH